MLEDVSEGESEESNCDDDIVLTQLIEASDCESARNNQGKHTTGLQWHPTITNYLVNNKNIRNSGAIKLNQAEQWDIHHAKQSTELHVNSYI